MTSAKNSQGKRTASMIAQKVKTLQHHRRRATDLGTPVLRIRQAFRGDKARFLTKPGEAAGLGHFWRVTDTPEWAI